MVSDIDRFFRLAATLSARGEPAEQIEPDSATLHPFERRNIHPSVQRVSTDLFDDGHYSQSSFEAWKLVEKIVQRISKEKLSGAKLMLKVFNPENPQIKVSKLEGASGQDEQQGFQFLFAGGVLSIRNPRAHEIIASIDDPDTCLDHLSFASMLMRRLENSGWEINRILQTILH